MSSSSRKACCSLVALWTFSFLSCKGSLLLSFSCSPLCIYLNISYAFDCVFRQNISTCTDDICVSNVARRSHHTNNLVFQWPSQNVFFMGSDPQCILNVFAPVFVAVWLSLECQRHLMPDPKGPTQTVGKLFVHIFRRAFPGLFTDTRLSDHTAIVCVCR